MAKKILLGATLFFIGLIVVACVVIALQPSTFSVERSATMAAPPAAVFAQVNDLKAWDAWSPWSKLDPNPQTTLSDPSAGKGATFEWNGNNSIGQGRLTILESQPDERVEIEQVFVRPMAGKARIALVLVPVESGTKVTWTMDGKNDFFGKAMCLIMDIDAMLGKDFEQALANIQQIVEKSTAAAATGSDERPLP